MDNILQQQIVVDVNAPNSLQKVLADCIAKCNELKSAAAGVGGGNSSTTVSASSSKTLKNAGLDELGKLFGIDLVSPQSGKTAGGGGSPKTVAASKEIDSLTERLLAAHRQRVEEEKASEKRRTVADAKAAADAEKAAAAMKKAAEDSERVKTAFNQAWIDSRQSLMAQKASEEAATRSRMRTTAAATFAGGLGAITGLSALANPFALERFAKASADLGAVIGRDLIPILNAVTSGVRFVADAWVALPGPLRTVVAYTIAAGTAAAGLVVANSLLTSSYVVAAASTVRQAAANVTLAGSLGLLNSVMNFVQRHPLLVLGAAILGATVANNFQSGASYGAHIGQPKVTDTEGYLSELQVDALKAGVSEQEKTNNWLEAIYGKLGSPGTGGRPGTSGGVLSDIAGSTENMLGIQSTLYSKEEYGNLTFQKGHWVDRQLEGLKFWNW